MAIFLMLLILQAMNSWPNCSAATVNRNFVITTNVKVEPEILAEASRKSGVMSISLCSQLCLAEDGCHNAVYDEKQNDCYLSINKSSKAVEIKEGSHYSYLEDDCSHSMHNTQGEGSLLAVCGDMGETVYQDCQSVYLTGETNDGLYFIQPDNSTLFQAYCVFAEGQGWTTLTRRVYRRGHFLFNRKYGENIYGVGVLSSEHFIGLEQTYMLTRENRRMRIILEDWEGNFKYAMYSTWYIENGTAFYKLTVSGYSGDAGDSFSFQNGAPFSAWDSEQPTYCCACVHRAAWWYTGCHQAFPVGEYINGGTTEKSDYAKGITWYNWKGYFYSLKAFHMMVGR